MKFGIMTQIQIPRPWTESSEREAYWNGLDQGVAAEAAGFEYFWITEQHFLAEIGHAPASDMFLAALSQRTSTIRLGLAVVLLPLHNPFSVAERVGVLDVLSNGRVEFGTGRGTTPYILDGYGVDTAESREMAGESLRAVMKMFEGEYFEGFKSRHYDLPARHVVPRPIQRPHPPLWIAASNLETYESAGRQGVGVIGVTRNTREETRRAIELYRAAIRSAAPDTMAGRVVNESIGAFGIACLDRDDRVGREAACAAARWFYGDNDAELNPKRFATAGGVEKIKAKIAAQSDEELMANGMAFGGNADTISRQIELWAEIGLDQIIFMFQAGRTTHDQVMRSIEIMGDEVIPRFA